MTTNPIAWLIVGCAVLGWVYGVNRLRMIVLMAVVGWGLVTLTGGTL